MRFDVKFKSVDYSESLIEYVENRFDKLSKFEIRPVTVHVTFSEERHQKHVDIFINGYNSHFRANSGSDSFYVSLDMCIKKLARQMEKEKSRIKDHQIFLPPGKSSRRAA